MIIPVAKSKQLQGIVYNQLTGGQKYNYGSTIKFTKDNILDIQFSKKKESFMKAYGKKAKSKKVPINVFFNQLPIVYKNYLKTKKI